MIDILLIVIAGIIIYPIIYLVFAISLITFILERVVKQIKAFKTKYLRY